MIRFWTNPPHPPDFEAVVAEVGLPPIGALVGRYELKREIARGAMGVVYLAWQHDLRRHVALKMILVGEDNQKVRERFESEWQAAAALDHPGIVPVFDVGSWQGRWLQNNQCRHAAIRDVNVQYPTGSPGG